MFLKYIHLENIKCFQDISIDFDLPGGKNRKWTVLIGDNGSGKTTLLQSIALILSGTDALLELVGDPDNWIANDADTATINAAIETAKGRKREISLTFKRGQSIREFLNDSAKSLSVLDSALKHSQRNYMTISYGASRRFSDGRLNHPSSRLDLPRAQNVLSLFDPNAKLNPVEIWAIELDYRSDSKALEIVSDVLTTYLPEVKFSHIDKEKQALMFETHNGAVPLRQLGSGYQNMAAWVGDLLYRLSNTFEDYENPLEARGLLIIDVVDLHLHPKWQRRLLHFLDQKLPNMQLVVTTHSVVTAQQAPMDALYYCIRREDCMTIDAFDLDPGNFLLHQLLATEAFGNMSDESFEVETKKQEYLTLYKKSRKTKSDRQKMSDIADKLSERVENLQDGMVLTPQQRKLMDQIIKSQANSDDD